MVQLNRYFDHTLLHPEAKNADIKKLCDEAKKYDFYAVCINSANIGTAQEALTGSKVKICSVVGFPLGACAKDVKVAEGAYAARAGASEVDMVINIGALKEGNYLFVKDEIKSVVTAAQEYGAIVKVIIEAGLLDQDEIKKASILALEAGAAYIKTSTGFLAGGATTAQVAQMKEVAGDKMGIKASGGIGDLDNAMKLIEAGATRLGSSKSVAIVEEWLVRGNTKTTV